MKMHDDLRERLSRSVEPLPDDDSIDGEWIGKFWEQLGSVQDNGWRILSKSLGGILSLQEIIGKCWSQRTPNVPTAVPVNEREPAPAPFRIREEEHGISWKRY